MAYSSGAEFLKRYDTRTVAKLLSDDGTAVANPGSDSKLAACLDDASGLIDSACMVGERYSSDDLTNLSGNSAALLKRLTCDLAMWFVLQRRAAPIDTYPQIEQSLQVIEMLREGRRVFDVAAAKDAGHADSALIPTVQLTDQNLLRDTLRYFPVRREVFGQ